MPHSPLPPDMRAVLAAALADRYTITREIGRGGMATVWLADDLKHQRQVAIKVLQPELGAVLGVERFLSEIRVTANLQHPNLLPLFDSGEADGLLYYVMPFVEGETLRARLDREQQLPIAEAVRLARALAGALDYAHQRGVLHRDLKPENVLLQAGQPVIADFGIALAVAQAGGQRVTQTGLSLGTPQYMSPEQATGDKQLDGRTDIYALGAIMHEMLTGEPPHVGNSAQAIIAKLMTEEVRSLTVLRRSVSPAVDVAVRRALEKLPADRFATAGAFADALGDGTVSAERYFAPIKPGVSTRTVSALAAVAALMTAIAVWSLWRARVAVDAFSADAPVTRFALPIDPDGKRALGGRRASGNAGRPTSTSFAFSPDGRRIVYAAWDSLSEGQINSRLHIRSFDDELPRDIAGTEGAESPVFSPDGQWIAFTTISGLRRVRVDGGNVQSIIDAPFVRSLAWSANDSIVFVDSSYALQEVAATGSRATPITVTLDMGSTVRLLQPLPLPNGSLLFHARIGTDPDSSILYRLDRRSGRAERLIANAADPRVIAREYLLFLRRGRLMAVRFDEATGTIHGEPVGVVDDVLQTLVSPATGADLGIGQFAVSSDGDLVFASGGESDVSFHNLVIVRPNGPVDTIALSTANIFVPRVSPSGDRIAFHANTSARSATRALFVYDLQRRVLTKITDAGTLNLRPAWSADGRQLAFQSDREHGISQVYVIAADGSGQARRVVSSASDLALMTWSSTGVFGGWTNGDIWTAREGEAHRPFFTTPETETFATFSPDGKWIAYSARKTAREEVFVRPYPGPDPAVQVSVNGGSAPAWSPDGRALYFLSTTTPPAMMRSAISANGQFVAAPPTVVFPRWPFLLASPNRRFDVLRDGVFVGVVEVDSAAAAKSRIRKGVTEYHVVLNFLRELRERVR